MNTVFNSLLDAANERGGAVGAFTCYDAETAIGVIEACEVAQRGAILLIALATFTAPHGRALLRGLRAIADAAQIPISIQLDHASDLAIVENALALGVDAIMADGSKLSFDENVALVRGVSRIATNQEFAVEAELGRIEGDEDRAQATLARGFTEPDQARPFVQLTSPDCLAVSIGNVHGTYREPPRLDFARLERIAASIPTPLSLHGASGLADDDLTSAVRLGVRKVNINTELRAAYLQATQEHLEEALRGYNLAALHQAQTRAIAKVVSEKLAVLG